MIGSLIYNVEESRWLIFFFAYFSGKRGWLEGGGGAGGAGG